MIIKTKNNDYEIINNESEFADIIRNEIGEEAREYYLDTILRCEDYDSLEEDYEQSLDENMQLEKENEELKYKLEMIENGKDKDEFNDRLRSIIWMVRELESVSKSKKVLSLEGEIIDKLKDMMLE